MKKWLIGLAVFLAAVSCAQAELQPFAELWNNLSYYDTNLEKKGFSSLLGRFEGKVGFSLFDSPLQIYWAYYGVSSQSSDYYDNSFFSGPAVRYLPFTAYQASGWQNEWIRDLKIYYESLSAAYFKDGATADANKLSKTDSRYGLDLWHEWNLDKLDETLPWGEIWANLSHRETNFGWEPFNDYVLYLQPKFGRHLGRGIEVYLRSDLTYSGKSGSSYSFLNIADYGAGIRFEPWRRIETANDLLRGFKMFVEALGVTYLKDKPLIATNTVSSDLRFGVEFTNGR
jgi:hypothetical protein